MSTPNFSIVLIALNEEARLERALTAPGMLAFLQAGGDVVVADTGSTDGTWELATRLGARVALLGTGHSYVLDEQQAMQINQRFIHEPDSAMVKCGDKYFHFASARNDAARHAAHDMVLQVDVGDIVERLDVEGLTQLVHAGVTRFEYKHFLSVGEQSHTVSRMYNRRVDVWRGRAHEALSQRMLPQDFVTPAGLPRGGVPQQWHTCTQAQLCVRNFKDQSPHKTRPYHIGMALDLMEAPNNSRWHHYLGRELFYQQRWTSALVLLEKSGAMQHAWQPERSASMCFAGQCYERLGRRADAMHAYMQAHLLDPNRREALVHIGLMHQRHERELPASQMGKKRDLMLAAACMAKAALAIPHTTRLSEFMYHYREGPHLLLSWAYAWRGDKAKAKHHWLMARYYNPTCPAITQEGKFYEGVQPALATDEDGPLALQLAMSAGEVQAGEK